uniref:RAMA domain-containing protein n=1 Tax=Scleropages formosus TaxID=113540 RepID=A0A8C9TIB5_SCLFO
MGGSVRKGGRSGKPKETNSNLQAKSSEEKTYCRELQRSINVPFQNIQKRNSRGESSLLLASKTGDLALVKALVNAGVSLNQADSSGWTPLHEACNLGHIAILEELLQAGADVSSRGYGGIIPLHNAVTSNHFKAVQLLLQYGSDPEITDESGKNSFDLVHDEAIRKLLSSFQRPLVGKSNYTARERTPAAVCSFCTDDKLAGVCNSKKQYPYKSSSRILEEVEKKDDMQPSNFTEPEAAETPVGDTEPNQADTVKDSEWLIGLIQQGIIKPGNNVFQLKLKGFCHTASLQHNGSLKDVRGQVYVSPQAWVQSLSGTNIPDSPTFAWKKVMYRSKSLSRYFMNAHPAASCGTESQQNVSAIPPETFKKDSYISSFMSINRILLINDDELMPSYILEHHWDELLYLDDWTS